MTDARAVIARQIEPQSWAALGTGDTLAYRNRRTSSDRKAIRTIQALTSAGFRILEPDEVDAVTVGRCAGVAEERAEWVPLKSGDMSTAIRALKEKRT